MLFSFERPSTIRNSPSPFTVYTKGIASAQAVDATTIRVKTNGPYPLLPNDLSVVPIVSKRAATGASTEDFNSGKATIGTGPYRFVRWAKGDRIELVRNDAYWGPKSPWDKVTLRIITADPARVAALLAGDVQAIENVPTPDLAKLRCQSRRPLSRSVSRPPHVPPSGQPRATGRRSSPTRRASRSTGIR